MAAHCANEQGKYWEMSHKIFENYRQLQPENLPKYAEQVGLDMSSFEECLGSDRYDDAIKKIKAEGARANVRGTPAFLVGYTQPGSSKFKPLEMIYGAHPYAKFEETINRLLKDKDKKSGP